MRDGNAVSDPGPPRSGPLVPLAATLAMQTLATMAAYSMPAAAPEIGRGLGVEPALVGVFISFVYGVGMVSALFSPSAIRRFGAARTGQFVMLTTAGMLVAAASGSLALLAASAVILGVGYGATAPVATHLIVPRTRPGQLNLILSIRQVGVPLGGTLAGLLVPPLVLGFGWQTALLVQIVPALVLLAVMQAPRARWDADRSPSVKLGLRGALVPLRLLRSDRAVRNLTFATFLYAGIQLCFVAFLVVHLTSGGVADLVARRAGPRRVPGERGGQSPDLGRDRGPLDRGPRPARASRRGHGRRGGRGRAALSGLVVPRRPPRLRGRGDDGERVHRHRVRRVRTHRRSTTHRSDRPRLGRDVPRGDGAPVALRPRRRGGRRLSPRLRRGGRARRRRRPRPPRPHADHAPAAFAGNPISHSERHGEREAGDKSAPDLHAALCAKSCLPAQSGVNMGHTHPGRCLLDTIGIGQSRFLADGLGTSSNNCRCSRGRLNRCFSSPVLVYLAVA